MTRVKSTAFLQALICIFLCLVLIFAFTSCNNKSSQTTDRNDSMQQDPIKNNILTEISTKSPQGFVYDVKNDCFVFLKGEGDTVYPGSTSKLITALYALSVLDPEKVITAGNELDLVKPGSSIAYIRKGHMLTVEMLIEGMMIPSGNDAAYVLAAAVGREIKGVGATSLDDIASFTEGVNAYAQSLGLANTVITVPDGYADSSHYTSVADMAILARAAMSNPVISKYARMYTDSVVYASGHINTWKSTNKLLDKNSEYYSQYATGLKTGSIDGGYSLLFTFSFEDGREYIAGVFGAPQKNTRFEDANSIINYLLNLSQ